MRSLYTLGIYLYLLLIRLGALFVPKAKLWWEGRINWETRLNEALTAKRVPNQTTIWVHSASLGEFEQGRPLMESIKKEHPDVFILLTFFSPSGYEIRKNYPNADLVVYLPADLKGNARKFIQIVRPHLAIFVKYEFWYNYLQELQMQQVPIWLIAAVFRPQQPFFQAWGAWYLKILRGFDHFFVQNQESADLLQRFGLNQYTIAGDPRVDRVLQIAAEAQQFPLVEAFKQQSQVFMVGSSWEPDEEIMATFWKEEALLYNWKLIIAPHEITESHLGQIEAKFGGLCVRYSKFDPAKHFEYPVLIIDNIGMLSALYRYADLAYIGGGFGSGIHNTLEPMAFGLPVIFGPKYQKFTEAVAVLELGGAKTIQSSTDLIEAFRGFTDPANQAKASAAVSNYMLQNRGATGKIISRLKEQFPHLFNPY